MNTVVYKEFSDARDIRIIREGVPLYESLPDIDFDNAVILVNGRLSSRDYIPKDKDVVTVRQLPAAGVSMATALIVAAVTVAIVAVGAVVGFMLMKKRMAANKLNFDLDRTKEATNNDEIDNRPFVRGASNTTAKDKSQPYICGRHLFTPYLHGSPWYVISGEDGRDEYTYEALELGFNRQVIQKIVCDDITMKTFSSEQPQQGAGDWDEGIFSEGGRYEIIQDGSEFTELVPLNSRIASDTLDKQIPYQSDLDSGEGQPLTFTLDPYALNVQVAITFSQGLYLTNDAGNREVTSATVSLDYSLDGGSSWSAAAGQTYSGMKTHECRYMLEKSFTLEDYAALKSNDQSAVLCRARLSAPKDNRHTNTCHILFYQSLCFDPNKSSAPAGILEDGGEAGLVNCKLIEDRERAYCTILGIRIKATDSNEKKLKKINVITTGCARIWDGERWSAEKVPTRNPGAWLLEVMTSDAHVLSKFSDDEIDLESFGELYNYCAANSYYFDYVVTAKASKKDLLEKILDVCGAAIYRNIYGKYAVAVDCRQENAVAVFTKQNVLSIENKKEFKMRSDALRVKYINSKNDLYADDTYIVFRDGVTALSDDSVIKDITLNGITTFSHVVKYARRVMALESLRPKITTVKVGREGIYFTPLSKVLLQDDSLKIGLGNGVITGTAENAALQTIVSLQLSNAVTFEPGKNYGIVVNHVTDDGAVPVSIRVSLSAGSGTSYVVRLSDSLASGSIATGDTYAWGELDDNNEFSKVTTPYLISTVSQADGGVTLELTNYSESVYDTGRIPDYATNITERPGNEEGAIPPNYVSRLELLDALNEVNEGNAAIGAPSMPQNVRATATRDGIKLSCSFSGVGLRNSLQSIEWVSSSGLSVESAGTSYTYTFDRASDGYPEAPQLAAITIRCRARNEYGKYSEWTEPVRVDVSRYGTWILSPPSITARVTNRTVTLVLVQPPRADGKEVYGTIRHRVQIKKTLASESPRSSADTAWQCPAAILDPYASEDNYKDTVSGNAYAECDGVYVQTLPLAGQSTSNIVNTPYSFRVVAVNEADQSAAAEAGVVALCTSIDDIVKANEDYKSLYVSALSAISANLGTISNGSLTGSDTNYWDLSSFIDDSRTAHNEGAFRVGGTDEYLRVIPLDAEGQDIEQGGSSLKPIASYRIEFKVGNFEVSTEASKFAGRLILIDHDTALDRALISPDGVFFEHRETPVSDWVPTASQTSNGINTQQVYSDRTLVLTNQNVAQRRAGRTDIGVPYISENSRVWHFDTDLRDQDGENAVAPEGDFALVCGCDSADLDCTPAILAVSPYANIGKSLYGQYSLSMTLDSCSVFTVDFWAQCIYAENQTLFEIGNAADKIAVIIKSAECHFFSWNGSADESSRGDGELPMYEEMRMSRLYRLLETRQKTNCAMFGNEDCLMFDDEGCGMFEDENAETIPVKAYVTGGKYYKLSVVSGVTVYTQVHVTAAEYRAMAADGILYERTCEMYSPSDGDAYVSHTGQGTEENVKFSELGQRFVPNSWIHIGIVFEAEQIKFFINDAQTHFARNGTAALALGLSFNPGRSSFLLDELLADLQTAESFEVFAANTVSRVPWGALDKDNDYLVIEAKDTTKVVTNLFESTAFRNKIAELLSGDAFYNRVVEIHNSLT